MLPGFAHSRSMADRVDPPALVFRRLDKSGVEYFQSQGLRVVHHAPAPLRRDFGEVPRLRFAIGLGGLGECAEGPSRRLVEAMMSWSPNRNALRGRVAVVAGATRGAGRGIAAALCEAGAAVICTGRSTSRSDAPTRSDYDRPETIEETAELVTASGAPRSSRAGRRNGTRRYGSSIWRKGCAFSG
jgi:hypothetical protein